MLKLHARLTGLVILPLDCPAEDLSAGDIVHLETPTNPTGEALEIRKYAQKAHAKGAHLVVDATFGPPGLQEPFALGADVVMHSGTKYLGGHSDLLCGVLATSQKKWITELKLQRTVLGNVMGSLEAWLAVRSLRTLALRVEKQSESATRIVTWLAGCLRTENPQGIDAGVTVRAVVDKVFHASVQSDADMVWLKQQMPNGFGPVFAVLLKTEEMARKLPSLLRLFNHATSLGGVESLVEWRAMSDRTCDVRLVRISVGVEDWRDLQYDLEGAFRTLAVDVGGTFEEKSKL